MSVVAALLVFATLVQPVSAQEQDTQDGWEWRATIYGWLPKIEGKTQFPTGADGPDIAVDASQILDNLDFTFMGTL